ncbi:MAG: insulinase family protein [Bacteroidales bacterium]
MKRTNTILAIIAWTTSLFAQVNEFKQSEINKIKDYKSFQLENGLTVILLDNGDTAGYFIRSYTSLPQYVAKSNRALLAVDNEIRKLKGFDLPQKWDNASLKEIDISLNEDERGFYAYCGKNSLDTALYHFSDLFQIPVVSEETLEKAKTSILQETETISKQPEDKIDKITKSIIYGKDHPVLKFFSETEINAVTPLLYKEFYEKFYKPNNSFILVMGKISKDSLHFLANKNFSSWKKKEVPESSYKLLPIEEPKIVFFDTIPSGETNIKILFPFALHPFTFDSEKAELLSVLFQKILSQKLITDMGLAKSLEARFESDKITGNYQLTVKLSKDSLNLVVQTIIKTISELKEGKYPEKELESAKKQIVEEFKNHKTNNEFLSWLIINSECNNLPKEYYADFISSVNSVNQSGIQTFSAKYLNYNTALFQIPGHWYDSLNEFIKLCGQFRIELYNLDGTMKKVIPKGFNGFSVIDNYISSVGGISNIDKIKDVSISFGAVYELSGGERILVEGQMMHKAENKYFEKTYMVRPKLDTVFLQQLVYDGVNGTDSSMYNKKKLQGAELEQLKYKSPFVPEIKYRDWSFEARLVMADTISGNHVWVVIIQNPANQKIIDFYDVDKGLRYKRIITDNNYLAERTVEYSNYNKTQESEILYPFLKIIKAKDVVIKMKIREIDYKTRINKKFFEIMTR